MRCRELEILWMPRKFPVTWWNSFPPWFELSSINCKESVSLFKLHWVFLPKWSRIFFQSLSLKIPKKYACKGTKGVKFPLSCSVRLTPYMHGSNDLLLFVSYILCSHKAIFGETWKLNRAKYLENIQGWHLWNKWVVIRE